MIGLYVKFIPKKKSEIRLNILVYSLVPNRRIEGGGGGGLEYSGFDFQI